MMSEDPIVYLNGALTPLSEAKISVLDRGFLFGDAVYEVIPVYGKRFFRLEEHLDRLANSLRAIYMEPPLSHTEWQEILFKLLLDLPDQSIYLQVTRGTMAKRDHGIPETFEPTVFAMATEIKPPAANATVTAVTLDDIRWKRCNIKTTALLPNVLLKHEAQAEGASEAIMIRDGFVTEGAASNVFAVLGDCLVTPPKGPHLLPGVTRDLILELAQQNNLNAKEQAISEQQLALANEIWLTSSTREIVPVIQLNGKPVGSGEPGALWQQMRGIYQSYKQNFYC